MQLRRQSILPIVSVSLSLVSKTRLKVIYAKIREVGRITFNDYPSSVLAMRLKHPALKAHSSATILEAYLPA